jgi:hypothetical protein
MIISLDEKRIRRMIFEFRDTGSLPEFIRENKFKSQFKHINDLFIYWQYMLDDDPTLILTIREMAIAYAKLTNRSSAEKLSDLIDDFQTADSKFRFPSAHSGYPFDDNPVLVLTYEASRAFQEKMGDRTSNRSGQVNSFILAFVRDNGKEILSAIDKDLTAVKEFIKVERDDEIVLLDAKKWHDELVVCKSTISTILTQIGDK